MASGDKRIASAEGGMPFGTEVMSVGPILLSADLEFPVYVPVGMGAIRVKKVRSVLTVVISTGDSVTTIKNKTVPMTGGTLTITYADSAVAAQDFCDIVNDANARVAEGDYIVLSVEGTTPTTGEAVFFIEYERCQ